MTTDLDLSDDGGEWDAMPFSEWLCLGFILAVFIVVISFTKSPPLTKSTTGGAVPLSVGK